MSDAAAVFFDGQSATAHQVQLRVQGALLEVVAGDSVLAAWPVHSLRFMDEGRGDTLRVHSPIQTEAHIVVSREVYASLGDFVERRVPRVMSYARIGLWLAATLALLAGIYFGAPLLSRPLAKHAPPWMEKKLGEAMLASFVRGGVELHDQQVDAALSQLARRLSATDVHVHVIDDTVENAYALPGGDIVLYCGLVNELQSSDELAGILAHESAHIELHHSTEALIRVLGTSFVMGAIVGDYSGVAGGSWQSAETLLRLAGSRRTESEADARGLQMLAAAHISAHGFVDFMERMSTDGHMLDKFGFLSTHPGSHERAEAAKAYTTETGTGLSEEDWDTLKDLCHGPE